MAGWGLFQKKKYDGARTFLKIEKKIRIMYSVLGQCFGFGQSDSSINSLSMMPLTLEQ